MEDVEPQGEFACGADEGLQPVFNRLFSTTALQRTQGSDNNFQSLTIRPLTIFRQQAPADSFTHLEIVGHLTCMAPW